MSTMNTTGTVPDAGRATTPRGFASYYGRPVLKPPAWKPLHIGGYLYLGGLAGASSVFAAGGQVTSRPGLARAGKVAALAGITLSMVALVEDLGRPGRFLNMLRVFKLTSPMSVGSWLLAGYGPLVGLSAFADLTGRLPLLGKAACYGSAVLGPAVTTYTAVLISDTAVPAWHEGHREMPFLFAGSATATAAGAALIAAPAAESAPARRAALFGTALELAAGRLMRHRMGMIAEPYHQGRAGALTLAGEVLAAAGAVGAVLSTRSRRATVLSGAALMAAAACTRFGVFAAGTASAADPKYTVVPQRALIDRMGE
ncbi:NrfD/PsrC family molybdoenzyme membrane anchor subunit [Sphaerisporangium aureirubrum]|uniref:NrfD/PsrC family molybdoenzyme membrane anchor subunit n=1 Tax=Sphaerisporangium aureirubrum TaxID=1544736 RepID=A0ABW1NAE0_9ACTN